MSRAGSREKRREPKIYRLELAGKGAARVGWAGLEERSGSCAGARGATGTVERKSLQSVSSKL